MSKAFNLARLDRIKLQKNLDKLKVECLYLYNYPKDCFSDMKTLAQLHTKQLICFFLIIFSLFPILKGQIEQDSDQRKQAQSLFLQAQKLRYLEPDSAILLFQRSYEVAMDQTDTLQAIKSLERKANVYGHQARYKNSYDELWQALFLADASHNDVSKAEIYIRIGRYYSFYKRRERAIHYFKESLNIKKYLVKEKRLPQARLVQNYYAICATYRELNEPELANTYLDSCFAVHSTAESIIELNYLKFELACIQNKQGEYQKALSIFQETQPWFETNERPYLVLFYAYLGDAYRGLNNFVASENYYNKSIEISKINNSHIDFSPIVHEKISDLHLYKKVTLSKPTKSLRK